jgi:hypothetical protein
MLSSLSISEDAPQSLLTKHMTENLIFFSTIFWRWNWHESFEVTGAPDEFLIDVPVDKVSRECISKVCYLTYQYHYYLIINVLYHSCMFHWYVLSSPLLSLKMKIWMIILSFAKRIVWRYVCIFQSSWKRYCVSLGYKLWVTVQVASFLQNITILISWGYLKQFEGPSVFSV